jgi:hypothetical protein
MKRNACGLVVNGSANPKWRGGPVPKVCEVCGSDYIAKRAQEASKYCSMKCVGKSQRLKSKGLRTAVRLTCIECGREFTAAGVTKARRECCSLACRDAVHSKRSSGDGNPNWNGGLSRMPYPYNFRQISYEIRKRDGFICRGLECSGDDQKLTAHHINYDKDDCRERNLITLCSSCNSKANFNRPLWQKRYSALMTIVRHRVSAEPIHEGQNDRSGA